MGLKILGGIAKGHMINIPKNGSFRPTSIRLKRRLFDFRQNWEGYTFIDLCAGSGAVGIESWSRGADKVFLVEKNRQTANLLKSTIKNLSQKFKSELNEREIFCINRPAKNWLDNEFESILEKNDNIVIFFDPPYHEIKLYKQVYDIIKPSFSKSELELWIESDRTKGLSLEKWQDIAGEPSKSYIQGTSFLILIES